MSGKVYIKAELFFYTLTWYWANLYGIGMKQNGSPIERNIQISIITSKTNPQPTLIKKTKKLLA